MKRHYWSIIFVYIAMQLSGIIGYPLLYLFGVKVLGVKSSRMEGLAWGYWIVISFVITLIIIGLILKKSDNVTSIDKSTPIRPLGFVIWSIIGVSLAFFAQAVALQIEKLLGIPMGSENTKGIMDITKTVPLVAMVVTFVGPIIEEVVFRKVIFGSLYGRMNFFLAALISSLIFAITHFDFPHILTYTAMGFSFALVYKVTKRIWVPIIAHMTMNGLVMLVQLFH